MENRVPAEPFKITAEQFEQYVAKKIASQAEAGRARRIFSSYGPATAWDVTNVLMHAIDLGKIDEVLAILEKHFDEHLKFQHPEIRGRVIDGAVNPTKVMFRSICADTLRLAMNTQEAK